MLADCCTLQGLVLSNDVRSISGVSVANAKSKNWLALGSIDAAGKSPKL